LIYPINLWLGMDLITKKNTEISPFLDPYDHLFFKIKRANGLLNGDRGSK
jgi:hypothetical protein